MTKRKKYPHIYLHKSSKTEAIKYSGYYSVSTLMDDFLINQTIVIMNSSLLSPRKLSDSWCEK